VKRARSARDSVAIRVVLTRLSELQAGAPVGVSQRLGQIPDDLRLLLESSAAIEGQLIATIREVAANLELGRPVAAEAGLAHADSLARDLSDDFVDAQRIGYENLTEQQSSLDELARRLGRTLVWWVAIGLALLAVSFLVISSRVTRPLAHLERGLADVAGGDLRSELEVGRYDEIGRLTSHFNAMTRVLRATARAQTAALDDVEERLRSSDEYLRSFIEEASDMITILNEDGSIRFVSPAIRTILGHEPADLVGTDSLLLIHPADRADVRASFESGIESGMHGEALLVRFLHKDGTTRQLETRPRNLLDHPSIQGVLTISRDMTDLLRREDELRQAQKMEAVGQLTGGIAHDFNNLLTVVLGNLDLMRGEAADGSDDLELIDDAIAAATRGADLTKGLLAFSCRQSLSPEVVDVQQVVASMIGLMRRSLGEPVDIDLVDAEDLWQCHVDASQLEAAILNLGINSRDAMALGGRLTLCCENVSLEEPMPIGQGHAPAGNYVRVSVTDTGPGMTPEVVERAFDPFFTTKETGRGSGLGLSMTYGFVKQSGGYVLIDSEVGVGTSVHIYLPRVEGEPAEVELPQETADVPKGTGELILVVEDDAGVERVATRQLERLGYRTLHAGDAAGALEILRTTEAVALLFTDIVLPGGVNGIQLSRDAASIRNDLKTLFVSGYSEAKVWRDGEDIDAELITKPYSRTQLASAIHRALNG
jgi:PAS domain S-box-containing protein